jgi:hypothetical protein
MTSLHPVRVCQAFPPAVKSARVAMLAAGALRSLPPEEKIFSSGANVGTVERHVTLRLHGAGREVNPQSSRVKTRHWKWKDCRENEEIDGSLTFETRGGRGRFKGW